MQWTPPKWSLFTQNAAEPFLMFAREKSPAVPAHRRGSFVVAHCLGVAMFGLGVHPIWMTRAEAAGLHGYDVSASVLLLTQPLEVIFIASHFIFPDMWKKKKKKTPKLFLTGLFFLFFSAATFKCTVKTFLGSNSFCALFWWKGAKMSFSVDENLSAGWTVYWSHWGDHLDSICRSFLTGSQHYCIYKTKAHCLLLINWIRSRVRHRPRSHREETGWRRVVWWKQMSLGERERERD